jgi:hypothetical protein
LKMMSYRRLSDEQLLAECRVETFRGPGPGGQKRNKTSSAIRITHAPTGLVSQASEFRSKNRNQQTAIARLRHKIALMVREPVNLTKRSAPELLGVSQRSENYPAAMGEVVDVLDQMGWSVSEAADKVGVSTGRLVRYLQADPQLWAEINRRRKMVGLRGLNT